MADDAAGRATGGRKLLSWCEQRRRKQEAQHVAAVPTETRTPARLQREATDGRQGGGTFLL